MLLSPDLPCTCNNMKCFSNLVCAPRSTQLKAGPKQGRGIMFAKVNLGICYLLAIQF